ncbi:hypothetical protein D9619_008171 [Psilocybe cf. subviscida]|uniref:DUF6533 domain-containing protein n=1 Tax=Psilocybe cf. subviscida TaxID=2480587 RepID=A0A8H5ATJ7_9AGAR|nr:hypothetical protein D9619_008171 [Psilocybe cf. subviscida]
MEDGVWGALASELARQNYVFSEPLFFQTCFLCAFIRHLHLVAAISVILWECLITFRQEVKYVWHCQSRMTKYIFWFCRYCVVGYFMACLFFGTQWILQIPISRNDCKKWFLIHVTSISLLTIGSQLILVRKVFNLYEKSTLLAFALFGLHCTQGASSLVLSYHMSASMNFNPICNSRHVPNSVLFIIGFITCNQCITWALILRKVRLRLFPSCRRHLRTSGAYVRMSWGLCLVAIILGTSHSFAMQRCALVYVFTFPIVVLSIGTCRYILRIEKDRGTCEKVAEDVDIVESKGEQIVGKEQSHISVPPVQDRHRHSYPPPQQAEILPPILDPGALSTRTFVYQTGGHGLDVMASNLPYLDDAQSSRLNRSRRNMTTTTNDDPSRSSSAGERAVSVRTSLSQGSGAGAGSVLHAGAADSVDAANLTDDTQEIQSASNIEIGSLHSSSGVNSEELRQFYNDAWNVSEPFMMDGQYYFIPSG